MPGATDPYKTVITCII